MQELPLSLVQFARPAVDEAQCSELVSLDIAQRLPGVKLNFRIAGRQRIIDKALIPRRIWHEEYIGLQDGVAAKGNVARGIGGIQTDARLEPLALGVHQTDQSDGHVEQFLSDPGDAVKTLFSRRVEDS